MFDNTSAQRLRQIPRKLIGERCFVSSRRQIPGQTTVAIEQIDVPSARAEALRLAMANPGETFDVLVVETSITDIPDLIDNTPGTEVTA